MKLIGGSNKSKTLRWWSFPLAAGLVAIVTYIKYLAQPTVIPIHDPTVYILAIVPIAFFLGLGPSVFASMLSVILYDYFFVPPLGTIGPRYFQDIPVLIILLTVVLAISYLASNLLQRNAEARRLTERVMKAQEEERKRLARELHDDTSPNLACLGLELDDISRKYQSLPGEVVQRLRIIRDKIDSTQQDIRRFSHELHPAILDNLGLEPALETLIEEFKSKAHIEIKFKAPGAERPLSNEIKLALYRIAQEALNNIRKYAKATEALVALELTTNVIRLSIADNGTGFDSTIKAKGIGLTSMKERAKLIGAELKIESQLGKGTTITAEVKQ